MDMKRFIRIAAGVAAAILPASCGDSHSGLPQAPRAIAFSTPAGMNAAASTRSASPAVFYKGDGFGLYACFTAAGETQTAFDANYFCNQRVEYDGVGWNYSPVKYWPTNGNIEFQGYFPHDTQYDRQYGGMTVLHHKCLTGLEPLYTTHTNVKIENGTASGEAVDSEGRLKLHFYPVVNKINFTAHAKDGLFDEEGNEYNYCRFLIKEFRIWGIYGEATYSVTDDKWSGHKKAYTRENPLEMTPYLVKADMETEVEGYRFDPENGYCTDKALVICEGAESSNLFGKSAYAIPMLSLIHISEPTRP